MREKGVGKPWSQEEDNLLIQAVAIHGECDNWKTVALSVTGRTNKACRKRWLHSLSPSVKKTAWTPDEDQLLLSLYGTHGTKWSVIARQIPGRTDDACSKRYREALDPSLKRDDWTSAEDALLLEVYGRIGGRWGQVGHDLNRSGLACRNRWRLLERKKASSNREGSTGQNASTSPSNSVPQLLPDPMHTTSAPWIPSLPLIDPSQYWNSHSTEYSPMLHQVQSAHAIVAHDAAFISPHFSPVNMSPVSHNGVHSGPPSPPPFQFASSSLSTALSTSRASEPSQYHETSSSTQSAEPIILHHTSSFNPVPHNVSNTDNNNQDLSSLDGNVTIEYTANTYNAPECIDSSLDSFADNHLTHVESVHDASTLNSSSPIGVPSLSQPQADPHPPPTQLGSHDSAQATDPPVSPSLLQPQSSRHYRTSSEKPVKLSTARKRPNQDGPPPRLSSLLPATADSTILAYACGHEKCWPTDSTCSTSCFATSQQLSDHWKTDHQGNPCGGKPFRCSLAGCGKAWKSINGLQYHLQISKAHFQQALSASFPTGSQDIGTSLSDADTTVDTEVKRKKTYSCPHPQCHNQYKQLSGLRYHLSHGHSHDLPAQLDVVPPVLARKVAQKMQGSFSQT